MGGASEAVSDAFSVATNPAALAHQKERVAAIEARQTTQQLDFLTGGTVGSFTSSSHDETSRGLSSAVLAVPGRSFNWALYFDEPLNVSWDTRSIAPMSNIAIGVGLRGNELVPIETCFNPTGPSDCEVMAHYSAPVVQPMKADVRLRRYGAALARSWGRVALGGSAQYAQLDEDTTAFGGIGQHASGGQFTWNAGTQIDLTSALRFGASYRGGADFDAERRELSPGGVISLDSNVAIPSSWAAGLAAEITPNLTIAVDAVRVNYSEITDANFLNRLDLPEGALRFDMPDVTELRAGAEYRLQTRVPVALRAGWWREPAHRVQAREGSMFPGVATVHNEILLHDQDENHVTAGIGIGGRVRFDAAFDRSENTRRASVGVATTF